VDPEVLELLSAETIELHRLNEQWFTEEGDRVSIDAVLAAAAALVAWRFSVAAERKPLETVARPLAFVD
jgi:hypothetical protein